jgi:tRNA(fMet)-specific endonuclease VapC
MKVSYLIDTDWIISQLQGRSKIQTKLLQLQSDGLGISIISLAELHEGIIYSSDPIGNQKKLDDFLSSVVIFDVSDEICQLFGFHRGILRKQGLLIGDFDLLIASTCLYHNFTLLTNNRKHFNRIDGLQIVSESD